MADGRPGSPVPEHAGDRDQKHVLAARSSASRPSATKRVAAKKSAAKKSASKKAASKKPAATKSAVKKAAPKKAAAKKAPAKAAPAKKAASKKTAATKPAAKKSVKKAAPKKTAAKKSPAKKAPAKSAAKQQAPTKPAAKKAPVKKTSVKKASARKRAGGVPALKQPVAAEAAPKRYVVRSDEKPWTKAELDAVRGELVADTRRLRLELEHAEEEIADLLRDSGDGAGDDQADAGTKTFEREHEMSLANNSRDMVEQNERALARIADGTYGVCESCGNPIGKARLQVFPRATLCVTCKQREERR